MVPHCNKLTSTKEGPEYLEVLQTLYFHLKFHVIILQREGHFHMSHRPHTPWTLLAPRPSSLSRPPDKVLLYSFDHYYMSRTTQPCQIVFDKQKDISYFFVEMFKTCYI